jgi:NTE family protein
MTTHVPVADAVPSSARADRKVVNLALQGGGAHGAFTWGVLDRLVEDERIAFEGLSATSAGAANAVVLAHGLAEGGPDGARAALRDFWERVSHAARFSPLQPSILDRLMGNHDLPSSPAHLLLDMLSRVLSPYQLNPLNLNPLRKVLTDVVDFERLRRDLPVKLFLSATNVRSGKVRVFSGEDVGIDAVLASACLPLLNQAVEIDGEHYWDGGYMGNPAIFPLIYGCDSPDVVVVHVNPVSRPDVPRTASEIMNRINEISFNSSLMREMRAIAFVGRLKEDGTIGDAGFKAMRMHAIEAEEVMQGLGVASKLNLDTAFLNHLHGIGRERAGRWLEGSFGEVGERSTVDVHRAYL